MRTTLLYGLRTLTYLSREINFGRSFSENIDAKREVLIIEIAPIIRSLFFSKLAKN